MSNMVNVIIERTASRRHDSVFKGMITPHSLRIKMIFSFQKKIKIALKTKQSYSQTIILQSI
jgi:hypothetical protein